jgi:GAF domain-containing protein
VIAARWLCVSAEGVLRVEGSSEDNPERSSPGTARRGEKAVESRVNPLFAGVGALCADVLRPAGVDGVVVAVLSPVTQSRELAHATEDVAQQLDELQYTIGEGPCFDAYLDDHPQFYPRLNTVRDAPRWPSFAAGATQLGVHALFAFPLPDGQRPMGVLELYRRSPGSLTDTQHGSASACATAIATQLQANWETVVSLAGSAAGAVEAVVTFEALNQAPDAFTRTQVHVAAGMVAEQLGISATQGIDRLRAHSYAHGRTLSSVAADIIARRFTLPS